MLRAVYLQLNLFAFPESAIATPPWAAGCSGVSDAERESRTGLQWIKAIHAYLEFRCGDGWRRLSDPAQRYNPERDWYLNGIRTLNGIRSFPAPTPYIHIVPCPTPDELRIAALAEQPRAWLVDNLLNLNPALTDRKLLMGLHRRKLACLVIAAGDIAPAELERTA
jgi:hypothetical protein